MADTAALVVALSAQLTKFEKDMKDAAGIADRGARRIEQSFNNINPSFEGIKKGLAALGVAEAIREIIGLTKEVAKLGESAETLGIGVEEFQKLRFAIVASGSEIDKAEQFLTRFSRSISDAAAGQGELAEWLRENNVNIKDASGNLLPLTELLKKFADLVKGVSNQQDRLNLVMTAGGRDAGPALLSFLQSGSQGVQQFMDEAERAGVVIDKELFEKMKRFAIESNKAWLSMKTPVLEFASLLTTEVAGGFRALGGIIKELSVAMEAFFTTGSVDAQSFADVARQRGIEALKRGEGTPLIKSLSGFPGQPAEGGPTKITVRPDANVKAFEALLEAQRRRIELTKAETKTIGESAGEQERLRTQITLESQAKQQNIPLTEQRMAAIKAEADAMAEATRQLAEQKFRFEEIQSASRDLGSALSEAFKGATIEGKKFDEVLRNLVNRLASRSIDKLFDLVFAPQGSATSSLFTQLLKGLVPGMATGGPVGRNQPFVVGEHGPELFVPNQNGMIVPNKVAGTAGRGATVNIVNNVDATGADAAAIARLESGLAASNRSIEQRAVNAVAAHRLRFA